MDQERSIAYFSMEVGLDPNMPTFSGGLGMLAGDSIRSAADMKLPLVAVSLLHRRGYFVQKLDEAGHQTEEPAQWKPEEMLTRLPQRVSVLIEQRLVTLTIWKYDCVGVTGFTVPVYLLDANNPENAPQDRELTGTLYGGDSRYRLCQEIILGIGGVRALRALEYTDLQRFHMNEGHAGLLVLELLDEEATRRHLPPTDQAVINAVRERCVFTTHTPVPAGHDKFPIDQVLRTMEPGLTRPYESSSYRNTVAPEGQLNLTYLALNLSRYINGVAKRHGQVSRQMFGSSFRRAGSIDSITNGVHVGTWASWAFQTLFDRRIPGWREDNFSLRYAIAVSHTEIWEAHQAAKQELMRAASARGHNGLDPDFFTIGFARRATAYKRADLLLSDLERLERIASQVGPFQVIYAGKAHPRDGMGKDLIVHIYEAIEKLKGKVRMIYMDNYDMRLGKLLTAGVDLWLNTPQPPMEASGTSGMKAAVNGVPSLSILDGWWIEGCIDGVTGWSIGEDGHGDPRADDRTRDAASLYDKLEHTIIPMFYKNRERYIEVMRYAISINGSFFNTQRMMQEYVAKAYFGQGDLAVI
jgi:starch phosphorylase